LVFLDSAGSPTSEAGKIGRLIGTAPIHQGGTTMNGITVFAKALGLLGASNVFMGPVAPVLMQMIVDSAFIKGLDNNTDTLTGVYQANIATK